MKQRSATWNLTPFLKAISEIIEEMLADGTIAEPGDTCSVTEE